MSRIDPRPMAACALVFFVAACAGDPPATGASPPTGEDLCFSDGEPFDGEARIYIEHNATDADTGVHGTFDQEGLAAGCLSAPDGTPIVLLDAAGQLDGLGVNQFFFESREPPNDEYPIDRLRADFPEGEYRVSGLDHEGVRRVGAARFTHAIPAPPVVVAPELAADEESATDVALAADQVTVRWEPVTETLDAGSVEIVGYEVIVTKVDHDDPDALSRPVFDVHLPPTATDLAVTPSFLEPGVTYELEVLAIEASGNQTITVGFFTTR